MNITFKQFLSEEQKPETQKSIKLDITLSDHINDNISSEIELVVDYQLIDSGQNYDHEGKSYEIDPESIEYIVNDNFEYKGKQYKRGMDLSELYDDVFIDDMYTKHSQSLASQVSNYFMKPNLTNDDKEEVFNDLLILMIEKEGK